MDASTLAQSIGEGHSLKPVLASIPAACKYMGNVSRAKFYADILPLLETVHLGSRHFVVVASIDRLIAKLKDAPASKGVVSEPRCAASPKSRATSDKR
jgi:hypothetical protein